jgi:DNA-binding transcriptional MerR regulator
MAPDRNGLRIGEIAQRSGTRIDTVRYYERLGLMGTPARTAGGYRVYSTVDLGRLQFIRRAKQLGFSLTEIRGLLGIAEDGHCQPLRRQVAELLRAKIEECDAKLAELQTFKQSLEERHRLTLERKDEPACGCATFPDTCGCLPIPVDELIGRPGNAASAWSGPNRTNAALTSTHRR